MVTKTEIRKLNLEITRAEISERAIEISQMCVDGSYKNAVACIGRMVALSKTIDDGYWDEKFRLGMSLEEYTIKSFRNKDHPDRYTKI